MIKPLLTGLLGAILASLLVWAGSSLISTSSATAVLTNRMDHVESDIVEIKQSIKEISDWTKKH